jgi:hypothetical protein
VCSGSLRKAVKVVKDVDTNEIPNSIYNNVVEITKERKFDKFADLLDKKIINV